MERGNLAFLCFGTVDERIQFSLISNFQFLISAVNTYQYLFPLPYTILNHNMLFPFPPSFTNKREDFKVNPQCCVFFLIYDLYLSNGSTSP